MSRFVREANKGYNEWFLYLLSILIVTGALFLGQLPALLVVNNKLYSGNVDVETVRTFWESPDFTLLGIPGYQGLALMMLGHVSAAIALYFCVRWFHKRSFLSVVTARRPFDWKRFCTGFGIWFLLTILLEIVMWVIDPSNYTIQFDPADWLPLILVCLLIVPVQTSIEEIFVRGYLFQGIGKATRSAITAVVLTSIVFVMMHMSNPEIQSFGVGVMITYYFSVAVFLAVLTYLDNGLELALGVHAATNIYGAAFVTFDGSVLQTEAILKVQEVNAWWMTAGFLLMVLIFVLIIRKIYALKPISALFVQLDLTDDSEIETIYDQINLDSHIDPSRNDESRG